MKISYGKLRVPLQRVVAHDDGRHDVLAAEVSIEVLGENFPPPTPRATTPPSSPPTR